MMATFVWPAVHGVRECLSFVIVCVIENITMGEEKRLRYPSEMVRRLDP